MKTIITSSTVSIEELSQIGEARRQALALAERLNFAPLVCARVGLIATEAASNILKHGGGGAIVLQSIPCSGNSGLEILALDSGPGMGNVEQCMVEGFSTVGSSGTGLGAIARLSDSLEIYSRPDQGTALLSRFWLQTPARPPFTVRLGVVHRARAGEKACGDGWAILEKDGCTRVLVVDGLGHGLLAEKAAIAAIESFEGHIWSSPVFALQSVHGALRHTRGAAAAAVEIDPAQQILRFAGIGNIGATLITGRQRRGLISHNGTLGHRAERFQQFDYPWSPRSLLILHTDGLSSHWQLERYSGLVLRHPALIAGILYRDFGRTRDDATVLVWQPEAQEHEKK